MHERLERMQAQHDLLMTEISKPSLQNDHQKLKNISKELADLEKVLKPYGLYRANLEKAQQSKNLMETESGELQTLAKEEWQEIQEKNKSLEQDLKTKLITTDDKDANKNAYLEIRAGSGGDESSLFAADLFRMYSRYAEQKKWVIKIISSHNSQVGGWKEIVLHLSGKSVYGTLCFESGVHRVQRVPATESQGRIHTSACTVAVLPEVAEAEIPEIDKSDLRVDTYRASGAGGQHVNKTDSAVRITHLPSGISVECQQERSQLQNRIHAMALLRTHLLNHSKQEQDQRISEERRNLVGSGDRSEKIRTYNFAQARVTDHRINLNLHHLPAILNGALEMLLEPLKKHHEQTLLKGPEAK